MNLEQAIAAAIAPAMATEIEARIAPMVQSALDAALAARPADVREVHVKVGERAPVNVGRQHETFPTLVQTIGASVPVWLVGPAGSGKTVAAERAAESLELAFSAVSVGPHTTMAHLFGYMDAGGTYRGTEVRARYERGGVLLLDEIDRGNPGVLTGLNALLANAVCAFPDGMIARHPDFRVVAAANTVGMGADRQYVGALQLDAATLDRFATLVWEYDEPFERELATASGGDTGRDWAHYVQGVRRAVAELKVRHVVSPRATLAGISLANAGMAWEQVCDMVVWRGLDTTTRERVQGHGLPALPGVAVPQSAQESEDFQGSAELPHTTLIRADNCPKCTSTRATYLSRIEPGMAFCWKKRGGCGYKWKVTE